MKTIDPRTFGKSWDRYARTLSDAELASDVQSGATKMGLRYAAARELRRRGLPVPPNAALVPQP